jgi:hypothetical protein
MTRERIIEILKSSTEHELDGQWLFVADAILAELNAEPNYQHYLMNLLAIIHCDGGHYVGKHGIEKACKDAEQIIIAGRNEVQQQVCEWSYDDDHWDSGCGECFEFTDGGPVYNQFVFCPYCGNRLKEVK